MKEDRGKGYETSDGVMMDINALKALIQDLTGKTDTKFEYSSINVKAESLDAVSDVEQSIKDLGYSTYSMQSMRDELNKQTRQIELMLGGLGAISLLVAAIGITNTMIMSISERTKEIGIMKALGCYVRDIRAMFLMEAGSIGLLGGILGLIFSFIISVIINLFSFGAFGGGGVTWELIKQALIGGEGVVRTSVIKPELVISRWCSRCWSDWCPAISPRTRRSRSRRSKPSETNKKNTVFCKKAASWTGRRLLL